MCCDSAEYTYFSVEVRVCKDTEGMETDQLPVWPQHDISPQAEVRVGYHFYISFSLILRSLNCFTVLSAPKQIDGSAGEWQALQLLS